MTKEQKIKYGLVAALCISLTWIVAGIFNPAGKPDKKLFDQVIKSKENEIATLNKLNEERDQSLAERRIADSLWQQAFIDNQKAFLDNQKNYRIINDKLKEIPEFIRRIAGNNDSIRRAFAEFQ